MAIDLSLTPYYDDFTDSKNYVKVLFKPGYAVQTRELNQIQSTIQNQIKKFGDRIFKNGTVVTGGQFNFSTNFVFIQVGSIVASEWQDQVITNGTSYANVVSTVVRDNLNYLVINYVLNGEQSPFLQGDNINVNGTSISTGISSVPTYCSAFTVDAGIFYVNGYFVITEKQAIYLGNTQTPSVKVGFLVEDRIVTTDEDSSLFDNAADTTNYTAPGADRLAINLTLGYITIDAKTPDNFIELIKVEEGAIKTKNELPQYSDLDSYLAKRTFEESGNYTISNFNGKIIDHHGNNLTGTITATSGSDIVTGTLTRFQSELYVDSTLILGGVAYTVYSIESDTSLTLTTNYSGANITDTGIKVYNPNQVTLKLDPGVAYISGFRNETYSPDYLTLDKGRDFSVVSTGKYFSIGNYLTINTIKGEWDLNNLDIVEFHSKTGGQSSSTIIGTAVMSHLEMTLPGIYKLFISDVRMNTITDYCSGESSAINKVKLAASAGTEDDMYVGAKIEVALNVYNSDRELRTIIAYDGSTKEATVDIPFSSVTPINTQYKVYWQTDSVKFVSTDIGQAGESTGIIDNNSRISKVTTAGDYYVITTIIDSDVLKKDSFIEALPNRFVLPYTPNDITKVQDSVKGIKYFYLETYKSQTWDVAGASFQWTYTLSGNSTFISVAGDYTLPLQDVSENIIATNANGVIDTITSVVISNSGKTITISSSVDPGFTTFIIKCYTNNTQAKYRRLIKPSLVNQVPQSLGNVWTYNGTSVYRDGDQVPVGVVKITNYNKTPGAVDSLYISQVHKLHNEFENRYGFFTSKGIKKSFKVIDSIDPNDFNDESKDITNSYILDDGQRSMYYDHASIVLKSGHRIPSNPTGIMVMVTFFIDDESAGDVDGYYTVDSYMYSLGEGNNTYEDAYNMIPSYVYSNGTIADLRDCIDYRPARQNCNISFIMNNSKIPTPNQLINFDFGYFMGRIDKVSMTENGEFQITRGTAGIPPRAPVTTANVFDLYEIYVPAWTFFTTDIKLKGLSNKRYTMSDLGRIEKRVENLEYYTALSVLEKETKNMSIKDEQTGLEMFKSGFLVDSFTSAGVVDARNIECYKAYSIDMAEGELRPGFEVYNHKLKVSALSENEIAKYGTGINSVYTLIPTPEVLIEQTAVTNYTNVNSVVSGKYVGSIILDPEDDVWVDVRTEASPVSINLASEFSGWSEGVSYPLGTSWNQWNQQIVGQSPVSTSLLNSSDWNAIQADIGRAQAAAAASAAQAASAIAATNASIANLAAAASAVKPTTSKPESNAAPPQPAVSLLQAVRAATAARVVEKSK